MTVKELIAVLGEFQENAMVFVRDIRGRCLDDVSGAELVLVKKTENWSWRQPEYDLAYDEEFDAFAVLLKLRVA